MSDSIERPDLYVVARILDVLRLAPGPMKKTPLQQAAGINYTLFGRYLSYLASRSLVSVRADADGTEWVELTARGAEALRFLTVGIGQVLGVIQSGDRGSPTFDRPRAPGSGAGWGPFPGGVGLAAASAPVVTHHPTP